MDMSSELLTQGCLFQSSSPCPPACLTTVPASRYVAGQTHSTGSQGSTVAGPLLPSVSPLGSPCPCGLTEAGPASHATILMPRALPWAWEGANQWLTALVTVPAELSGGSWLPLQPLAHMPVSYPPPPWVSSSFVSPVNAASILECRAPGVP